MGEGTEVYCQDALPEQFRSSGNIFREPESQRFEADRNLSCVRSETMFGKKRLELTIGPLASSVNVAAADLLVAGT